MSNLATATLLATTLALSASEGAARTPSTPTPTPAVEIGYIAAGDGVTLRRMLVRNTHAKGTVLFLHGFPETLYAWKDISLALGDEFEVHAFDWPGFGLSSRPPPDQFGYAPRDYARVLKAYIDKAGIDRSKLTIYATDIGALPALLAALDDPGLARLIIVGDFAPFDRPQFMYGNLQALKVKSSSEQVRAQMNLNRDEILANAFRRGLPEAAQYEVSAAFKADMAQGWDHGGMTSADAFHHYYAHFTRDQDAFESRLSELTTPVKIVWGTDDLYIRKDMGVELASRLRADLLLLPGVGHYPHLQAPEQAIAEVRGSVR